MLKVFIFCILCCFIVNASDKSNFELQKSVKEIQEKINDLKFDQETSFLDQQRNYLLLKTSLAEFADVVAKFVKNQSESNAKLTISEVDSIEIDLRSIPLEDSMQRIFMMDMFNDAEIFYLTEHKKFKISPGFIAGIYQGSKTVDDDNYYKIAKNFVIYQTQQGLTNYLDKSIEYDESQDLDSMDGIRFLMSHEKSQKDKRKSKSNFLKSVENDLALPLTFPLMKREEQLLEIEDLIYKSELTTSFFSSFNLARKILEIIYPDEIFDDGSVEQLAFQMKLFATANLKDITRQIFYFDQTREGVIKSFIAAKAYNIFSGLSRFVNAASDDVINDIWKLINQRAQKLTPILLNSDFSIINQDKVNDDNVLKLSKQYKAIEFLQSYTKRKAIDCFNARHERFGMCQIYQEKILRNNSVFDQSIDLLDFNISDAILSLSASDPSYRMFIVQEIEGLSKEEMIKKLNDLKNESVEDVPTFAREIIFNEKTTFLNHVIKFLEDVTTFEDKEEILSALSKEEKSQLLSSKRIELLNEFPLLSYEYEDKYFYEMILKGDSTKELDEHLIKWMNEFLSDEDALNELSERFVFYSKSFAKHLSKYPEFQRHHENLLHSRSSVSEYDLWRQLMHKYVGTGFLGMIVLHGTRWATKFFKPTQFITPYLNEINKKLSPYLTGFVYTALPLILVDSVTEAFRHNLYDVPFYENAAQSYFAGIGLFDTLEHYTLESEFFAKKFERYFAWIVDGLLFGLPVAAVAAFKLTPGLAEKTISWFFQRKMSKLQVNFEKLSFTPASYSWSPDVIRAQALLKRNQVQSIYVKNLEDLKVTSSYEKQKKALKDSMLQEVKEIDKSEKYLIEFLEKGHHKWQLKSKRLAFDFKKFGLETGEWNLVKLEQRFKEVEKAFSEGKISERAFNDLKRSFEEITMEVSSIEWQLQIPLMKEYYAIIFSRSLKQNPTRLDNRKFDFDAFYSEKVGIHFETIELKNKQGEIVSELIYTQLGSKK